MGPIPYYSSPPDVPIVLSFAGFTTLLDTVGGDYQVLITSNVTGDPSTMGIYDLAKTPTSLTITPRTATQDILVTIVPFNQTGPLQNIIPLSKRYHWIDYYTQACEDAHADTAELNYNERFMLLNRAVVEVLSHFYALVATDYQTRAEVTIAGLSTASEATVNVSGLPMMRLGAQVRVMLEMPQCPNGSAEARTQEEYMAFRSGNSRDRSTIIYYATPDTLYLKRGQDVTTWGTAYGWFPRIPLAASLNTDWADVPDALAGVVIFKLSMLIRSRLGKEQADVQPMIDRLAGSLSQSLGANVTREQMKTKVSALL